MALHHSQSAIVDKVIKDLFRILSKSEYAFPRSEKTIVYKLVSEKIP